MNPIHHTGKSAAGIPFDFALVPLDRLRDHEEVVSADEVRVLAERIARDGSVRQPIVADRETLVVLDGHHRLNALRLLGAKRAPVHLVDYRDPRIVVETWRAGEKPPTKEEVVARALAGNPLPPKATKHAALYGFPEARVSLRDLE